MLLNANLNLWERTGLEKSCPLLCNLLVRRIHNLHFRCFQTTAQTTHSEQFIIKIDDLKKKSQLGTKVNGGQILQWFTNGGLYPAALPLGVTT